MLERHPLSRLQRKSLDPLEVRRYNGEGTYIAIPKVTSERRKTIPLGFVRNGMNLGDKLYFIQSDSLTLFGILMSQTHNAWMRAVAGRMKTDYSYANTIVYNNFVLPDTTALDHKSIEDAAQRVLDARKTYPDASLADLYDPDNENKFPELTAAHQALDKAVERAYGWELDDLSWDEKETFIVSSLFELYSQKVNAE